MDQRVFPALLLTSVLLVVSIASPALIASANGLQDFVFLDWLMFPIFSAVVGFAFLFAGTVMFAASVRWLPKGYQLAPTVLFVGFVICAALFFPTTLTGAMLDPVGAASDVVNLVLCVCLAVCLALLSITRFAILAVVFITVSSVSATISYGHALFRPTEAAFGKADFVKVGKKNVFVVSFDGLSGDIVTDVIRDNPEMAAAFSDFVLFTDAFSGAPTTEASMRSESFGVRNYHSLGLKTERELRRYLEQSLATDLPVNSIPDSMTYGYIYSQRNLKIGDLSEGRFEYAAMMHRMWFEAVVARIVTPKLFTAAGMRRVSAGVEALVSAWLRDGQSSGLAAEIRNYKGVAPWKAASLLAFDDFNGMVRGLHVGTSGFTLRKMHFAHSHFPVDFDSRCRMRSTDAEWPKTVQNEEGLREETKCWLRQYRAFKEKLVKLGIYDSSAIIFKSDHGAPVTYFKVPPRSLTISDHPLLGYDRYRPMLMIKGFDMRSPRLVFNNSLVGLPDLARTTCLLSGFNIQRCRAFPGVDLLSPADFSSSRDVYLEVVQSRLSSPHFEDHFSVGIRRDTGRSLLQSMRDASLIKDHHR